MASKTTKDLTDWEEKNAEGLKTFIEKFGFANIKEYFERKLEEWQHVEVNIAVTGNTGVGKSCFINAIRGLYDGTERQNVKKAEVGVTESTEEPEDYEHPSNPNIKFWDLPGMGGLRTKEEEGGKGEDRELEAYCQEVKLKEYDAFLIIAATRFTKNDLKLAKKINSIGKKFFFIRTKIDQDCNNEKIENRPVMFNEDAVLNKIRADCVKNLKGGKDEKGEECNIKIFLISNHHPMQWDFRTLEEAILDALPRQQREVMTYSLKNKSTEILKRKVDALKGRLWLAAAASAAAATVPIPGVSIGVDLALIMKEIKLYKSLFSLPEEGSSSFLKLSIPTQAKIRAVFQMISNVSSYASTVLVAQASEHVAEEFASYIPVVGFAIAGGMSFTATYLTLKHYLEEMEAAALKVVEETVQEMVNQE